MGSCSTCLLNKQFHTATGVSEFLKGSWVCFPWRQLNQCNNNWKKYPSGAKTLDLPSVTTRHKHWGKEDPEIMLLAEENSKLKDLIVYSVLKYDQNKSDNLPLPSGQYEQLDQHMPTLTCPCLQVIVKSMNNAHPSQLAPTLKSWPNQNLH